MDWHEGVRTDAGDELQQTHGLLNGAKEAAALAARTPTERLARPLDQLERELVSSRLHEACDALRVDH